MGVFILCYYITMNENQAIQTIKKCAAIGDKIFSKVCLQLKKPLSNRKINTEIELANFIKNEIIKAGGEESFPVIVTSGPRAGNDIHPVPTDSKLTGFVIIDFGIKIYVNTGNGKKTGYCSDMSRTVYVKNGKNSPIKNEIDLYNTILNAQNGSIRYFKAGLPVSAPDAFVRGFLTNVQTRFGYLAQYFIHTLGHGISKKVHEKPKIFFKSREVFKAGQVVTSEPGIYIPNTLGIRIEDMYLITEGEPMQITKSKKELLVF